MATLLDIEEAFNNAATHSLAEAISKKRNRTHALQMGKGQFGKQGYTINK